jgi:hypothetical protein
MEKCVRSRPRHERAIRQIIAICKNFPRDLQLERGGGAGERAAPGWEE